VRVRKQLLLPLALGALAAALLVPAIAGADATQSVSQADNQTATASFVQLAGNQSDFFANARKLGLNVTARQKFGLWNAQAARRREQSGGLGDIHDAGLHDRASVGRVR
jgi:hypothetical protein